MTGNVSEWCSDWYSSNYYSNSPNLNPKGPSFGKYRVLRGGNWSALKNHSGLVSRGNNLSDQNGISFTLGMRLVLEE